jgi:hypothetical protein
VTFLLEDVSRVDQPFVVDLLHMPNVHFRTLTRKHNKPECNNQHPDTRSTDDSNELSHPAIVYILQGTLRSRNACFRPKLRVVTSPQPEPCQIYARGSRDLNVKPDPTQATTSSDRPGNHVALPETVQLVSTADTI